MILFLFLKKVVPSINLKFNIDVLRINVDESVSTKIEMYMYV